MKITILCENTSSEIGLLAEWGFSVFIQTKDVNILFDTGYSDVYKRNAKQLDIDLNSTDFIILSHHHNDHSRGLQFHNFKTKKKLIIHPQILEKLPPDESQKIKTDFEINSSTKPLEFAKNIFYLGEIPRRKDFEKGMYKDDKMLNDSAIAIKSDKGVIVISGCSHAGICNICEYAKEVTGQKLYAVIGGFHLSEDDKEVVAKTIDYFQTEKPELLYPMHCVDFPTLSKFHSIFGIKKVSTGDEIKFDVSLGTPVTK